MSILFSRGPTIRSIWLELEPKQRLPSRTWLKYLGKCVDLRQLRFNWADPGRFEDCLAGLVPVRSLQRLHIDNFAATKTELMKIFTSNVSLGLHHLKH